MEAEKDIRYSLPAGTYTLRAIKDCYFPYENKVIVVAGKTRQFKINFRKIHTDETRSFKRSFPFDIAMAGVGIGLISSLDNGPKYGVPALLTGLLGYGLWRSRMSRELDLCTGMYNGPVPDGDGWRLRLGIAGNTGARASLNSTGEDEFFFDNPNGPNILFLYNLEAEIIKNDDESISEGLAYSLALEKFFTSYFGFSVYGQYTPQLNLLQNYRVERRGTTVVTTQESIDENSLFLYGLDFLIGVNRSPHHQISLILGGYGSNSISGSAVIPLNVSASVPDEPMTEISYEYTSSGFKAGVRADFWIAKNTGIWMTYELLAQDKISILNDSETNQQPIFQMGFMREF